MPIEHIIIGALLTVVLLLGVGYYLQHRHILELMGKTVPSIDNHCD